MIKIVVMDKNFISVGVYTRTEDGVRLDNAALIRYWGTKRGLGEIAAEGPTSTTVLDKTPPELIPWHSVVKLIDCIEEKWLTPLGITNG